MTCKPNQSTTSRRHRTAIAAVLCLCGVFALTTAVAQSRTTAPASADDGRVHLDHADVLHYDRYKNPDAQILNGNVAFSHKGATLFCDSAYFYEKTNSFEAYGNVKMYQGDTLSLFSDYAFYDGNELMAEARYNVVLTHRESTLYTDSLNFDRLYNVGYFFEGGRLVDGTSTLTSDWGEYHMDTKQAVFNYDVKLRNERFFLATDTLHYDTNTSTAHALGPSDITSGTSHIHTVDGYYDTRLDQARLFKQSVLTDEGRRLTGDSVYYDNQKRISEAFGNVVYDDTANRSMMTSDYYYYNDSTGFGLSTRRAVAIDYSGPDSLYMHADTFKIFTFNQRTDSVYRVIHAFNRVRAYRTDVQAVCDSLVYNTKDSCLTLFRDPIAWSGRQQVLGETMKVYMKDSTINRVHVIGQALSVEQMNDGVNYNQVSSDEMLAFFRNGDVREVNANNNVLIVYYPIDDSDSSLIGLNYTETTQLKVFIENRRMQKVWMPKADGTLYPMTQIPPNMRFLPTYAWFDYVRPVDKDDIFNWRPKAKGTELKVVKRKTAPLQYLDSPPTAILSATATDTLGGDSTQMVGDSLRYSADTVSIEPAVIDSLIGNAATTAPPIGPSDTPSDTVGSTESPVSNDDGSPIAADDKPVGNATEPRQEAEEGR